LVGCENSSFPIKENQWNNSPEMSQKLFWIEGWSFPKTFPKTFQKFNCFQNLSGACNLPSVNRFVFTGPSSTMTSYFAKDWGPFFIFSGCFSSTHSNNEFLSETTLKRKCVLFMFFGISCPQSMMTCPLESLTNPPWQKFQVAISDFPKNLFLR
jgi:hypothetical protein